MRVLMLSKACIVGTYQRKLEEMVTQDNDLELRVVVPPYWRDERGVTELERTFVDGYDLVVTPLRFNGNFHLHYYPRFAEHVRAFRPDIVHIDEEPYNLATWLALRPAKRSGAKTLFFSWQNIVRRYPWPFRHLERHVLQSVDHAIVGTQSAAEVWRQKGYDGPMTVIPQFGVDTELFAPLPHQNDIVQIGYAGRLWSGKGVDLLIEALGTLKHLQWHLQIIGSGPEQNAIEQRIGQMGLHDRVTITSWVPSTDMPSHMQKLDILVIPSRTRSSWKEQYGRVIVEAMACEVAVIGSDSGAIPDVIGDAGLVFPEDDHVALADRLQRLIEDSQLRHKLSIKGRQRVLANFTQQQIAAHTTAVYHDIMHRKKT